MSSKKILILVFLVAIASVTYNRHRSNTTNTPSQSSLPNIARAYNLYSDNKETDIYGSTRTYIREDLRPDWVSLSCNELVGNSSLVSMVTRDVFKGFIGFNPKTGEGVWSGELPYKGIIQTGKVSLLPNSYGGFDIEFTYDNGKPNIKCKLAPVR